MLELEAVSRTARTAGRLDPGAAIARRRRELGYTQEQLAARAKLAQETVSHIETGRRGASAESRAALARALRCKVRDLWPDEGAA